MPDRALARALAALDRALAAQPDRDDEAFAAATDALCEARDAWLASGRGRDGLRRLNGVISAALAGHFPIGRTSWPHLAAARDALTQMASDDASV